MTPETIKCLCEFDISNHLKPGDSIEDWFKRLTQVTYNIALNLNTPSEILAILAKDSAWYVRANVAQNPNTSQESLAILARDSSEFVRWYIAKNYNTSSEILAILARISDVVVSFTAKKQLKKRNKVSK